MIYPGFVGPSSQVQSPLGDAEQLINWRPIINESPNARTPYLLLRTPGLSLFATLKPGLPSVRGAGTFSGRTFFVAGTHLFEVTGSGGVTDYGDSGTAHNNIVDDGLPVTMVAGGTVGGSYPSQLLIASGGSVTVFSLASSSYQAITGAPTNVLMVEFLAGYFIALTSDNTWQVSNVEDATNWSGLAIAQVSVFSDQLLALIESNEIIWVFGAKRAVGYYLSGAALFPFDVASGAVINVGIIAQYSAARIQSKQGSTLAWLGGDDRGAGVVYALNGFNYQRISDQALEYWLSQQSEISDAVGMARQDEGQNFYDLWFPAANTTWTLDVDNGWWHQRKSLVKGLQSAHLGRCHTYNFGLHLVGDRTSGNVYNMSANFYSENVATGLFNLITRVRVGPSIANEGGQITVPINEFQIDFQTGIGPQPPLTLTDPKGRPRDPVAVFSYSEDYGRTWGSDRMIPCGQAGQFKVAAIDRRLGSWRSWTPRVVVSDPVAWVIAGAYVNSTQQQTTKIGRPLARIQ